MEEDEYKAIKAKMAYREYLSQLPNCDRCDHCLFVSNRKQECRVCLKKQTIIDNRIRTCPRWCPKII